MDVQYMKNFITIGIVLLSITVFNSCNFNDEEKAAERYRDMVRSSTGKTISVGEASEMLRKLENEKNVKSGEIEQTMNLLKAKYEYKIFPPNEFQGKMIFTFMVKDYLLKDENNILFIGQLDDITNEEGNFTIHLFSQLQLSDWQGKKIAHFNLRCSREDIEPIIAAPPGDFHAQSGFQKQYFVICKIHDVRKVTTFSQFNYDHEKNGLEILVDAHSEYQIDGDLIEIIPYPK